MAVPKIKDMALPRKKLTKITKPKKERRNPLRAIAEYLKEVRLEFRKVIWPSRRETTTATIVVIVTLVFFVLFIGVFDFVFSQIVRAILPLLGG